LATSQFGAPQILNRQPLRFGGRSHLPWRTRVQAPASPGLCFEMTPPGTGNTRRVILRRPSWREKTAPGAACSNFAEEFGISTSPSNPSPDRNVPWRLESRTHESPKARRREAELKPTRSLCRSNSCCSGYCWLLDIDHGSVSTAKPLSTPAARARARAGMGLLEQLQGRLPAHAAAVHQPRPSGHQWASVPRAATQWR